MPVWIAILLGAVQGLAEFLPISSSGHLALLQHLLNFSKYGADAVAFDLVLHLGTLVAVIAAFWSDVKELFVEFFKWAIDGFRLRGRPTRRLLLMEERGIVGPFEGSKPRAVLITKDQWKEMCLRRENL